MYYNDIISRNYEVNEKLKRINDRDFKRKNVQSGFCSDVLEL